MLIFMKPRYKALDEKESEHICERVVPQLQHANGSVVLSAVKVRADSYGQGRDRFGATTNQPYLPQVIMIHMRNISAGRADLGKQLIRKMAPPLVTLVSSAPEVSHLECLTICSVY